MSFHYTDPEDKPRACPCNRGKSPGLIRSDSGRCFLCNDTHRLGTPGVSPQIEVERFRSGLYRTGVAWFWRRAGEDWPVDQRPFSVKHEALAAAREELTCAAS